MVDDPNATSYCRILALSAAPGEAGEGGREEGSEGYL